MIKLVIGLGNPGRDYAVTRHNIGAIVVERFKDKFPDSKPVMHIPSTFMNRTGFAVKQLVREHNLEPQQILAVCDDFALELGQLRIRLKGSAGSHNGLKSIINELGTQEFPRLRVGIGPLPPDADPAEFVLSGFTRNEKKQVQKTIELAIEALQTILTNGIETAMNTYNRKTTEDC